MQENIVFYKSPLRINALDFCSKKNRDEVVRDDTDGVISHHVFGASIKTTRKQGTLDEHHHYIVDLNSEGLASCQLRENDELLAIKYEDKTYKVITWNHQTLLHMMRNVQLDKFVLIIQRSNTLYEVVITEMQIDAHGGVSRIFTALVSVLKYQLNEVNVQGVRFNGAEKCWIRHGAMTGSFLTKSKRSPVMLKEEDFEKKCSFIFKEYIFSGLDCKDTCLLICLLQHVESGKFIIANFDGSLSFSEDDSLNLQIDSIQKPDPRYFIVHIDDSHAFLESIMFKYCFIMYDQVNGLTLHECNPPPWNESCMEIARNYSFEFLKCSS